MIPRPRNPNSHLTAKERDKPSFPTRRLLSRGLIRGRVLDYGCGLGADVDFLREKGFDVTAYDPYYAPDYPEGKFDTILCHYVLNVIFPNEQSRVLMHVSELLKPSGTAYYTVRRDLRRPGFRIHKKHRKRTYQCNVKLPFETELRTEFCEIYRYQHHNQVSHTTRGTCPFCAPDAERELLTESALSYALLDMYPVTEGHVLVIPKVHEPDYFALSEKARSACWMVVQRAQELLAERYDPGGFNVGINAGQAAGQTIDHAHIHLIPRYEGDVENPAGGVRNVIPGKGDYLNT